MALRQALSEGGANGASFKALSPRTTAAPVVDPMTGGAVVRRRVGAVGLASTQADVPAHPRITGLAPHDVITVAAARAAEARRAMAGAQAGSGADGRRDVTLTSPDADGHTEHLGTTPTGNATAQEASWPATPAPPALLSS